MEKKFNFLDVNDKYQELFQPEKNMIDKYDYKKDLEKGNIEIIDEDDRKEYHYYDYEYSKHIILKKISVK